jgi:hypothetical protein
MEGLMRLPCFGFRSEDGKRACHEISGISNERAWRKRLGTLNRRERVARLGGEPHQQRSANATAASPRRKVVYGPYLTASNDWPFFSVAYELVYLAVSVSVQTRLDGPRPFHFIRDATPVVKGTDCSSLVARYVISDDAMKTAFPTGGQNVGLRKVGRVA